MQTLIYNPTSIVTVDTNGRNVKRGKEMNSLKMISDYSILTENGIIKDFIKNSEVKNLGDIRKIDVTGMTILPGLVECHTHSIFAGSRSDEFIKRLSGTSYEEIAKLGGGINSTVKAVRESSFETLVTNTKPIIDSFIAQGVTTLEIKSGYGLSFYDEIKILQVIKELNSFYKIDIIPTFLGAHTFPPEYSNDKEKYLEVLVKQLLPYVSNNRLSSACDAFCESTAFSVSQIDKIFSSAKNLKMNVKLHTDQFNSLGGIELALKHNALSVDHLEVINSEDINKLKNFDTVAVLLPGVSYFLNHLYAPARVLIENDSIVALATDFNPGSSHIKNISLIWSLAAIEMKMSIEEIISAYTINASKALNLSENFGSIEIGKAADFSIFDIKDISELIYNPAENLNKMTIKNGEIIYEAK